MSSVCWADLWFFLASYDKVMIICYVLVACCWVVHITSVYIVGRCCFVKRPSPTCATVKLFSLFCVLCQTTLPECLSSWREPNERSETLFHSFWCHLFFVSFVIVTALFGLMLEKYLKNLRKKWCQDGSLRHCATNIVIGEGGLRDCGEIRG